MASNNRPIWRALILFAVVTAVTVTAIRDGWWRHVAQQSTAAPQATTIDQRPFNVISTQAEEKRAPTSAVNAESQSWACEQDGMLVVSRRRHNEQCRPYANDFATSGEAPDALANPAPTARNSGSHRQPEHVVQTKPACQWLRQRLTQLNELRGRDGRPATHVEREYWQRRSEWLKEGCNGPAP